MKWHTLECLSGLVSVVCVGGGMIVLGKGVNGLRVMARVVCTE